MSVNTQTRSHAREIKSGEKNKEKNDAKRIEGRASVKSVFDTLGEATKIYLFVMTLVLNEFEFQLKWLLHTNRSFGTSF